MAQCSRPFVRAAEIRYSKGEEATMPKFSGTHFLKRGGGEVEVRPHSVPSVFLTGKRLFQARATKARASLPCFSNVAPKSPLAPFLYPGNRCKQQTPSPLPPLQSPDKKTQGRRKGGKEGRECGWVDGFLHRRQRPHTRRERTCIGLKTHSLPFPHHH